MKGSEPIFKSITFEGDANATHGILIYENNLGGTWNSHEVFTFNEGKMCIINQLEIFRILDGNSNKTFKFFMERIPRNANNETQYFVWNQNYNPYNDGSSNTISSQGNSLNKMSFYSTTNCWLNTNYSNILLMPRTSSALNTENLYITKIYVKAEDYYQALI
jgi:hypothetical protein